LLILNSFFLDQILQIFSLFFFWILILGFWIPTESGFQYEVFSGQDFWQSWENYDWHGKGDEY